MHKITRRNTFAIAAGAALAASTGTALAFPAPCALDPLIAAYHAAKAKHERAQSDFNALENSSVAAADSLPSEVRFFSPNELLTAIGAGWVKPLPLIDLAKFTADQSARALSDFVEDCIAGECVNRGIASLGGEADALAAFGGLRNRMEAIDHEIRPRFEVLLQAAESRMRLQHKAVAAAISDASMPVAEKTAEKAHGAFTEARIALWGYRPVTEAEREAKGALLFECFGDGCDSHDSEEFAALLASLYPARA
jgi:hypothetical protein